MKIIRKVLYLFYGKIQGLMVPGLVQAQYIYISELRSCINKNTQWLDLGCGQRLVPRYFPSRDEEETEIVGSCKMIAGIDSDYYSIHKHKTLKYKVLGDMCKLPFKDSSFSLITANMVVEHIENPILALAEISRILKPNGVFIFHTPNLLNYQTFLTFLIPEFLKNKLIVFLHQRHDEDVFPTYHRMNTQIKVKHLAKISGFNVLQLKLLNSKPITIMLGPIVIIELVVIKVTNLRLFRNLRSNIIAVFQKANI